MDADPPLTNPENFHAPGSGGKFDVALFSCYNLFETGGNNNNDKKKMKRDAENYLHKII